MFERKLSKAVIRMQPVFGHVPQKADSAFGGSVCEITVAVALERLAGLADHGRAECGLRREVSEKIIRQGGWRQGAHLRASR